MRRFVFACLTFLLTTVLYAELTVEEQGGVIRVLRDGQPLVESVTLSLLDAELIEPKRNAKTLPDGTRVWNLWSEHQDSRVRMEVARRGDGAVEISMLSNILPLSARASRFIQLKLAAGALIDKPFDGVEGNSRSYKPVKGVFDAGFKGLNLHWLATDGLIFDLNPTGNTNYCSMYRTGAVKGIWSVVRKGENIHVTGGTTVGQSGGFTGIKMVILEGKNEDHDRMHFMRAYQYSQHLHSKYLLAFGSPAHGSQYKDGNLTFGDEFGWADAVPEASVGYKEGALYSCVTGEDGLFQVKNLPDGFYVCTVACGNYQGLENRFSLAFNDDVIAEGKSIAPRKVWIASKTVHVKGGTLNVRFKGRFLLSTFGLQPLMGDAEDYSIQRPFWVSEGYEPALICRNVDFPREYRLPVSVETLELPVPGKEFSAEYRQPPRPTLLPPPDTPSLAWLGKMQMGNMGAGMSAAAPSCPQEVRTRLIDGNVQGKGYNCVMSGFMHSRHTYPTRFDYGVELNRTLAREAHSRNLKIIDHHDVTILWNQHSGLRTLAERLPELCRGLDDHLPSFQLCPLNPEFKQKYFEYWRKNVEAGIDGFQLDEVQFWPHTCSCHYCREAFTRDTGWIYPLNELDPSLKNENTVFNRRWHDWRMAAITNWFIDLRKYLADIKPDLVLSMYTTHWGFTRSAPRYKSGYDMMDLARTFNMFGTEVMTRNVMKSSRPLLPLRKMKNIITREYGTRIWGIYYTNDWESTYFAWAVANMCGQSAVMAFKMPEDAPKFGVFAATDGNMKRDGAEQVAQLALLFSAPSRDWNRNIGFEAGLFGMAQELEALHIPYEMIANISLRHEILAKYKVLSIGSSACLSDRELEAIMAFARQGGTVLLNTVAGLCDETGVERKEWPFRELFGFSPVYYTKWSATDWDGAHSEKPVRTFLKPGTANLLHEERPFGKGRFIYCALDVAGQFAAGEKSANEKWTFAPDKPLQEAYRTYLKKLLALDACWEISAPDQLYTTLWREADGTLAIHFLNATGARPQPGEVLDGLAPKPAFPELPSDITFRLAVEKATSVTAASPSFEGKKELAFVKNGDGTITVRLPAELAKQYVVVKIK